MKVRNPKSLTLFSVGNVATGCSQIVGATFIRSHVAIYREESSHLSLV